MIRNGARSAALLLIVTVGRPEGLHRAYAEGRHSGRAGSPQTSRRGSPQADISGTWSASFDTQIGRQDYTYQFQLKEETLTGKASSVLGESDIENGKVQANKITFVENLKYQGTTLVITYSGTIVSAEEIRFTRQVGQFAAEEFLARRIKP
jgi:hypothetical protein